ncbi:MAG: asparagine synthase C-terminal domain-containing protein [Methanospirillaceae archaeon]|nr:asparagine synthase C-terminal domain-containing protein [Methanospirillaceae archaeon]
MDLIGWVEYKGNPLNNAELITTLSTNPRKILACGGEFYLSWDEYKARDYYGIIPGPCPAGTLSHNGRIIGTIEPPAEQLTLEEAIITAVRLRSDTGVTALSGGVDSTLVAYLAGLPCLSVGCTDSHDIRQATHVSQNLGLPLQTRIINPRDIEEALSIVVTLDPTWSPVDVGIATSLFCISEYASELGYRRILTGQGADELFGGYTRHLHSNDLAAALQKDFLNLANQVSRDQRTAACHATYLSMPYLDTRVVCAASQVPVGELIMKGVRKRPLRIIAARHIPAEFAYYEKKAMQYGTGIWKEIKRLARHNGYNTSVQDYINSLRRT